MPYQNIAVFLDGTEAQDDVMDKAIELAAVNHAALTICHVIDSTALESASSYPSDLVDGLAEAFDRSIVKKLDVAKANPDIKSVSVQVECGRLRETIMDVIIEPLNPDFVICGARGLSTLKYALLGSVSTFLVRNCPCDVLVVKNKPC